MNAPNPARVCVQSPTLRARSARARVNPVGQRPAKPTCLCAQLTQAHTRGPTRCVHIPTGKPPQSARASTCPSAYADLLDRDPRALPHDTLSTGSSVRRLNAPARTFTPRAEDSTHPRRHHFGPPLPAFCVAYECPPTSRPTGLAPCRLGSHPLLVTLEYFISSSISCSCLHRHRDVV